MSLSERAKWFGYVPQKIPFPHISVIQTVMMGRYPHKSNPFLKVDAEDQRLAEDALKQMGLTQHANRQLYTLSGGEVQRVFIAQSIAKQAEIYFFDEPMSALDPEYQADFLDMISWLSEQNATIIFTTHNPNHVFSLSKKARVGILGKDHVFQEIAIDTQHGVEAIEKAYNGAVSVSYLEQEKQYVARFNMRRTQE
jgi:ABC-type cobalamin/Fe3+-siderophores transport system ATPase subunit